MYDRILFPTAGSEASEVVLDHVLDLADAFESTVHVLNVADTTRDSVLTIQDEVVDVLEQEGERIVQQAASRATERRVEAVTEVRQGEPYSTIIDYATSRGMDLIVMPTKGRRGLERFLLGSTTERVVRRSDVPVLTIRPTDGDRIRYPYGNVLVPTDGSSCASEALAAGVDLTVSEGATLHLLSAITLTSLGVDVRTDIHQAELEASAETILAEATEVAEDAGVDAVSTAIEYAPSIHQAILAYIDEHDIGLVAVGTHGRTGFNRYVLGSVTEYLIRTSPIPVLSVRPREATT